jgi:hypothetical protein
MHAADADPNSPVIVTVWTQGYVVLIRSSSLWPCNTVLQGVTVTFLDKEVLHLDMTTE